MKISIVTATVIVASLSATVTRSLAAQQAARAIPVDTVAGVPVQGLAAILLAETLLESERSGDAAAAARVNRAAAIGARGYEAAARDPALSHELLARAITNHYAHRSGNTAATQATDADEQLLRLTLLHVAQNARLVEQNDRIIQLLEGMAPHSR
jgi:hypothetical protein